jgi:hypothetical protein
MLKYTEVKPCSRNSPVLGWSGPRILNTAFASYSTSTGVKKSGYKYKYNMIRSDFELTLQVLKNAETATAAEMAESHLVTVARQARHGQCYWEYIYIQELELHLGISSTLKNMTYISGNTPYILGNTPYISGNTTYVSGNKRMSLNKVKFGVY